MANPPSTRATRVSRTFKDEVASYIRGEILSGEMLPGEKIDQDAVSDLLGVSKLPVREALIQLGSEGLVSNIAHRGAYVAMSTPDDVRDHYTVYGLVSGLAASRAAARITPEQIAELERVCDQMESSDDMALLQELNVEFHRIVNRAGSSDRLLAVLRYIANSLPANFYEFAPDWTYDANKHHRTILQCLKDRDADAAAQAMSEHTRLGGEFAVNVLMQRGLWAATE